MIEKGKRRNEYGNENVDEKLKKKSENVWKTCR